MMVDHSRNKELHVLYSYPMLKVCTVTIFARPANEKLLHVNAESKLEDYCFDFNITECKDVNDVLTQINTIILQMYTKRAIIERQEIVLLQ